MNQFAANSGERRQQTRHAVRCCVVAIAPSDRDGLVQPVFVPAQANDVSLGGAKLLTRAPLRTSRLWLRLADCDDTTDLFECRVVRQGCTDAEQMDGFFVYGLKFRCQLSSEQLASWVQTPQEATA